MPAMGRPYCFVCAAPKVPQLCDSCRSSAPAFDSVRAPFEFRGPARRIVHDLKFGGVGIAAPYVARLLAGYLRSNPYPADAYCPVPLHSRRERNRGFNQSSLIARELSALTGVPVEEDALRRSRHTPPQVSMDTAGARHRNIAGAFESAASANGKRYILIDDVVTTGSTMSACAAALKDAGATHVWGIGFARQGSFGDDEDNDRGDGVSGVWV
ncbi:MAG: ComF family protein [Chloroflexi bacterium]|nr:ComF family protein [Chloroflexota bacterium]